MCEAKAKLGFGRFTDWCLANYAAQKGPPLRTAERLMKLYRSYPQIRQIGDFDSVHAALRALPKKTQKKGQVVPFPSTDPQPVEPPSAERKLVAQDRRIAFIEQTVSPDERESMEQAPKENEIIRKLNSEVALWKAKCKDLKQENIELKKRIKELEDAASL